MPLPMRTGFLMASFTFLTLSKLGGTGLLGPETMTASAPPRSARSWAAYSISTLKIG